MHHGIGPPPAYKKTDTNDNLTFRRTAYAVGKKEENSPGIPKWPPFWEFTTCQAVAIRTTAHRKSMAL